MNVSERESSIDLRLSIVQGYSPSVESLYESTGRKKDDETEQLLQRSSTPVRLLLSFNVQALERLNETMENRREKKNARIEDQNKVKRNSSRRHR